MLEWYQLRGAASHMPLNMLFWTNLRRVEIAIGSHRTHEQIAPNHALTEADYAHYTGLLAVLNNGATLQLLAITFQSPVDPAEGDGILSLFRTIRCLRRGARFVMLMDYRAVASSTAAARARLQEEAGLELSDDPEIFDHERYSIFSRYRAPRGRRQ
jgi:hypothetical protein